ncbi:MAG: polymerase subunit delta [Gemmatimonadales bacterium]|nr:polymerase subunit delta [Gemmatimonadales bacterium]
MDALFRSLNKGEVAPVYYLHGHEDVLKDEAVRMILDRTLDPGLRDFNFDQRSAAQLDPEEIHSLCNTLPMLAERRVVVLRDVEGWKRKTKGRAEFLRYLERPSLETVVVLVQGSGEDAEDKELSRGAYTVRFDPLPADRAERWVVRRADQLGLTLDPETVRHLVRSVGSDVGALQSELAKLASLPSDETLTPERLGELVGIRHGETQWDWREAVLNGETGRAVAVLLMVLGQPGVSGVRLVTQLGTALVGLGITRTLYDKGLRGPRLEDAVVKVLIKNRPYGLLGYKEEAASWARWAPQWPVSRIRAALRAARTTDESLKNTTVSDERGLLTDLVLQVTMTKGGEDGNAGDGGSVKQAGSNQVRRLVTRALVLCSALSAFPSFYALSAQTDPRLVDVIRDAQQGQGDSARIKVQRLLATTPPGDTLYPQILYTQAMVATDAAEMRRQLQRVAVEHSSSSWADDALLRLVQLDYASGNLDGAARNLERLRRDYPGSTLLPQTSYWAARTYFDQKNPALACRWLADGLAASRGNVELENQLGYLNQRCPQLAIDSAPRAPADSPTTVASAPRDTIFARRTDSTPTMTPVPPTKPTRPDTTSRTPTARPAPTLPSGGRFRVQVTAVRTAAAADAIARKLNARGLAAVTVPDAGLYKVRVGNYASRAEALAAVPKIKAKLGGSPFVVAEP